MITISKPISEDAEGIHKVIKKSWYATYINEEVGVTKEDINAIYVDNPEGQINAIRNRAENSKEDDISLVAKFEEKVLGYIRLKIHNDFVELISLYVDPEYMGNGIGTQLWEQALKLLPKDKPIIVEVATYTKAVEFYKKLGFVDTEERYSKEKMLVSKTPMPLMKMVYKR